MAFLIKSGDTLPNLSFQLFQPDGVTPLSLTAATKVMIAVRTASGGPLLFKKNCVIQTAATGLGYYNWVAGDTDNPGSYEYEFEITWSDGNIQTIPADSYFSLVIVDDVG